MYHFAKKGEKMENIKTAIENAKTALGIEFGSTRIKAVLIGEDHKLLASGSHDWENELKDGIWTYSTESIIAGLQDSYKKLAEDVKEKYGITLKKVGAIGISAMMHGYLAFDKGDNLLVPFRTWRNTITEEAADKLTKLFGFNIPQRWSIAHLQQAILNGEEHVKDVEYFTTLAGYVHKLLTGENVLGVGDASGMFPIDSLTGTYNREMAKKFDEFNKGSAFKKDILSALPKVFSAGECGGYLSVDGAKLLDPSGNLESGIPLCPPEGDAGTGMTATNSVQAGTGNVSAGTSVFAMIVLEKELSEVYTEIDMVTTPDGMPTAMVHCNNCCGDIDAWVKLFSQVMDSFGISKPKSELYDMLYNMALEADKDCGGVLTYNLFSGEPILGTAEGRPMLIRKPDASFSFKNLARSLVYSSFATLKIGMDILTENEGVKIDKLLGHGGLFKTKGVAQSLLASALGVPVSVMPSAGEGGAWGIAILADFMKNKEDGEKLYDYLNNKVFASSEISTEMPKSDDAEGFKQYIKAYVGGVEAQKVLVK